MRTHLGCTGVVQLGPLSEETCRKLEHVPGIWLEFDPEGSRLEVRHVQPDDVPALREIAGELVEFLADIPQQERARVPGGSLFYLDEETGQHARLKVAPGGYLTVAWAQADYSHAKWEPFKGKTELVFEPYQRLNGECRMQAEPSAANRIRAMVEVPGGLYPQGDYEITSSMHGIEVVLRDVNASVLPLLNVLREVANPRSLEGQVDVSSFRAGDLEDYARFVFKSGEVWLVHPALWNDAPAERSSDVPLDRAA
jgi:hypothetical protein